MGSYLQSVWRCRYFWFSLVKMDLRTRYRGSILGMGWSLLQPLAMTVILCTVFHQLFKTPIREYGPFLISGLICWNYILSVSLQGCQSFFQNEVYIRQYPAPMAIYPLRTTLGAAFHLLLALGVVLPLCWWLQGFGNLPALPFLLFTLALLIVLGWSLAVLAAVANVHFQDSQHLLEIGFQILFYLTPIMYKPEMLADSHLDWILKYNPLVAIFRMFREPILDGRAPSVSTVGAACLATLLLAGAAAWSLARHERRIVFHL